jgi:hypothetical protein
VSGPKQDESTEAPRDWGLIITAFGALALAAVGWVATGATGGALRVVCELVILIAGAYAVCLLGLLLTFAVSSRIIDRLGRGGPERVGDRVPALFAFCWLCWSCRGLFGRGLLGMTPCSGRGLVSPWP